MSFSPVAILTGRFCSKDCYMAMNVGFHLTAAAETIAFTIDAQPAEHFHAYELPHGTAKRLSAARCLRVNFFSRCDC
jgi:hypothetical protein